ncbi:hypothetical protein [Romboutsia lituseburensis]|uniref:hypothetical protein n=1 Tax=Romboutsia lituseburensis TaxID=1537 RepID=UPI0022EA340D|nr:hypothetical protein [Romboutsia lituseburensis]
MNINYIFLLKKQNNESLNEDKPHYEILNNLFVNVGKKSFDVNYENSIHTVDYIAFYSDKEGVFKLSLSLNKNESESAKILGFVDKSIRKGISRKDYNIIISYDEVSEFYSNEAHKLLNRFERKIRELIYTILIKTFGVDWYDKTVNDGIDQRIKETCKSSNQSRLIESALQEMTLYDLEMYLFQPYPDVEFNDLISDNLNEDLLNSKNKDELVLMISSCIPKSLWERFFENIVNINDIQEKLGQIRKYRNIVAHSKDFYKDSYIDCKNVLDEVVNEIDFAIKEIEKKEFNLEEIKESYYAYDAFTASQNLFEVTSTVKEIQEQVIAMRKVFEGTMKQYIEQNESMRKSLESPMKQYIEQKEAMRKALESPMKQYIEQKQAMKKALEVTVNPSKRESNLVENMLEESNKTIKKLPSELKELKQHK